MNSKERIIATIKGEKTDRVPIFIPNTAGLYVSGTSASGHLRLDKSIYPTALPPGFSSEWKERDANYLAIIKMAKEKCDMVWSYHFPVLDRKFMYVPERFMKVAKMQLEDNWLIIRYEVHTPKGTLQFTEKIQKNVSSIWVIDPLIKEKSDVDKLLSIPFTFQEPDLKDFFQKRETLGENGVMIARVDTAVICVARLFSYEQFLTWCLTEKVLIRELMEVAFERIYNYLEFLLKNGVGPVFRFGAPEIVTPPKTSPQLYQDLVVKWEKPLYDAVHSHGNYVAAHYHGPLNVIFDEIMNMGADLTDPVEPLPYGDIGIDEAKRRAKGKIVLVGNIPYQDMQFSSPEAIDKKVKEAICSEPQEKFILTATDAPCTFVSDRLRDNYFQLIESGIKYGTFGETLSAS